MERYKTGGGPASSSVLQPHQEKILATIKGQINPLTSTYDSNRSYCKGKQRSTDKFFKCYIYVFLLDTENISKEFNERELNLEMIENVPEVVSVIEKVNSKYAIIIV